MTNVYEGSAISGAAHVSCIKYRYLNNISHYHSDHELVYVERGTAKVSVNDSVFYLNSDECVFIHSNDIHYIQSDRSTVITVFKVASKFFEGVFASRKLLSPMIKHAEGARKFLNDIRSELNTRDENGELMADCIATQFLITVLRREQTYCREGAGSEKHSTSELYSRICKKISSEYSSITFEEAAKYMSFSAPYFSKVFHNLFGMSFTQYLNTVRIAAAIEKLKQGNADVTTISAECGFNTIRNFNRVFKNFTGYSPRKLPRDYSFLYALQEGYGLNPTLNCTLIINE